MPKIPVIKGKELVKFLEFVKDGIIIKMGSDLHY